MDTHGTQFVLLESICTLRLDLYFTFRDFCITHFARGSMVDIIWIGYDSYQDGVQPPEWALP